MEVVERKQWLPSVYLCSPVEALEITPRTVRIVNERGVKERFLYSGPADMGRKRMYYSEDSNARFVVVDPGLVQGGGDAEAEESPEETAKDKGEGGAA